MKARREFRDRPDHEVAVLDALVDRNGGGMTVLELRTHVDVDIDELEAALANLKEAGLIEAREQADRTLITVADRVVPDGEESETEDASVVDRIRDRLGL